MISIVYTMGKVGSTAISRALKAKKHFVYDIHTLDADALAGRDHVAWHDEVIRARHALRNGIESVLLITVARDPVARNLSGFFENLDLYAPKGVTKPHQAIELFLEKYSHRIPINWFEREMMGQAGVNLYDKPFDHERKVQIKTGMLSVVAFRDDTPDATKSDVINEMLEHRNKSDKITIARERTSAEKPYGELYKLTVETAWSFLPASYLDEMYDNDYVRHFWTPEEVKTMRAKWSA